MPSNPNTFVVATFADADSLLDAVRAVRAQEYRVYDVFAPYPVHGLDEAMGVRHTRLPWVTFLVGLMALTFALTFQFYAAVFDWPVNVGGKPDNSTLAFLPICFELTVLIGGLSTVAALLLRAKLYPGKKENLAIEGVTNDKFALALRRRDSSFNVEKLRAILHDNGAEDVQEKVGEL